MHYSPNDRNVSHFQKWYVQHRKTLCTWKGKLSDTECIPMEIFFVGAI